MILEELAIVLDTHVDVRWIEPRKRFLADLAHVDELDGRILRSLVGVGSTREEALQDYASQIGGKRLVVNAWRENRKEITAPPIITAETTTHSLSESEGT